MIYNYTCICGKEEEKTYPIGTAPQYLECTDCLKTMYRVITVPAIHFRGDGFTKQSA